jgi:hypothetical protein
MDLKTEWEKLEPQIERAASNAAVVSGEVMEDLKKQLVEFRQRLGCAEGLLKLQSECGAHHEAGAFVVRRKPKHDCISLLLSR